MKKVSNHLGEIIVAIACVALLITSISLFDAPISNFFSSVVSKEKDLGGQVMTSIGNVDVSNIGVAGGGGAGGEEGEGEQPGEGEVEVPDENEPAEVPENVELFYTYTASGDGYRVSLTNDFRTALTENSDYVVDGETVWTAGSALPNPGSIYNGKPVVDMSYMLDDLCVSSLDLSGWDTSNVVNMSGMFANNLYFTSLDLSSFDTSNVTDMSLMFMQCSILSSVNLSSFDTSNVTSMEQMFNSCYSLSSLDLSSFDTSKADLPLMLADCNSLSSIVARTEADKANIENSLFFPEGCTVTVK